MSETAVLEFVPALLLLTDLLLLGSGRFRTCIRIVALQGAVAGLLPILLPEGAQHARAWAIAAASATLKGAVFPWFLRRVLREAKARRESEPFVGHALSILAGVAALIFALWLGSRLAPGVAPALLLVVQVGLATLLVGLFLIVARRNALSQVLGYIVVENGIYTLGVALAGGVPLLVELAVLLDAFVAVFIMSIAAYHISREFDHLDVDQLNNLQG